VVVTVAMVLVAVTTLLHMLETLVVLVEVLAQE
jgi:hypothetical protein